MSWRVAVASIILVAAGVLLAIIIFWGRSLERKVDKQRSEIIAFESQLRAKQQQLSNVNLDLARRRAQLQVVTDALEANERVLQRLRMAASACPDRRQRQNWTEREHNLCELIGLNANDYAEFIRNYISATGARVVANSDPEFEQVRQAYENLLPLVSRMRVTNQELWAARVYEGMAYSDYRLRRWDRAVPEIDRAIDLDQNSAFVTLTALKIACEREVPANQIRELYDGSRGRLERDLRNARGVTARRHAEMEARYLQSDQEVQIVCGYAGLRSTAAPWQTK